MTVGPYDDDADDGGVGRPSKSARKRAAHAAQDLGEALLRLPDAELTALELPRRWLTRSGWAAASTAVRQRSASGSTSAG